MSRKPGEAIRIGEAVVVKVLKVEGGKVQLGIEAPRDVKIATVEAAAGPESPKK
jgi:carbon storage regulator